MSHVTSRQIEFQIRSITSHHSQSQYTLHTVNSKYNILLCVFKWWIVIDNYWENITKDVHSIIYRPFGLNDRYEGLKTYKQVLNWISIQEITIPSIKM